MGSKRVIDNDTLVVNQSLAATFASASTNILHCDRVGYQLSWTGAPVGVFGVDVSNDAVTWIALTLSTPVSGGGAPEDAFIDVETAAKYVRLTYTRTSGTGTLQAKLTAKSISG